MTALTAPPAMTPVPSEAGLSMTEELSNLPRTSCGIVVLRIGTLNMFALARSCPLPIAAGTVLALPRPTPRSEEHTSELQSRQYIVCRLLLEKKQRMLK